MTGHVFIYSDIGTGPGEVSINNVKSQIDPKATDYILHIISRGGDVFEGYGIYNILKNTGKPIITHVEGLCASIASLVAFAGEKIVMNRTSEFMVHPPKISEFSGEAPDLRNAATQLDKISDVLVDVASRRVARNGKTIPTDQLKSLYDKQTWLTSQQALDYGFVDEVVDAIKAVAKVDLTRFKMKAKESIWTKFENFLNNFKNSFTDTDADGKVVVIESEDDDWVGKKITYEDGSPISPGAHQLASGKVVTVDEDQMITQQQMATEEAPAATTEDMDNKIKELESQLAQMKQDKETAEALAVASKTEAETVKQEATTKVIKFENRVKEIEKQYLELKEEVGQTVGDKSELGKGPVIKNIGGEEVYDPMAEEFIKQLKARNIIES